jgi:hypothetical protein
MVGLPVDTFATGVTTAEGRLNVSLGGQSTTHRCYSRGTPSTLRAYAARGIFSSASYTAGCCSGRGSRGRRPRSDPRVVICVAPAPAEADDRPAWVELALGPGRPARVRVGARHAGNSERSEPSEPKNDRSLHNTPHEGTLRKKGSEGSDGSGVGDFEDCPPRRHGRMRGLPMRAGLQDHARTHIIRKRGPLPPSGSAPPDLGSAGSAA